jgi:rsbT antagonist protein RsbS
VRVPILKQGSALIASVQSVLSDADWLAFQDELIARVGTDRSRGVIIDVAALDVLDSYAARILSTTAKMAHLRGAIAVIVGIQPEVAFAMIQLGLTLDDVATALDLEDGLALLDATAGGSASGG